MKSIYKNKKTKMFLISSIVVSFLAISSFSLISCGSISENLIQSTVYKGDGNLFANSNDTNNPNKYDLKTFATNSLENLNGARSYSDYVANKISLNWIQKISKQTDNESKEYKKELDAQIKFINESYTNVYEEYKKNNGNDFELVFQQNILDPDGGTEQSWKDKKLLEWARTYLQNKIFTKSYLTLLDTSTTTNKKVESPSKDDLKNGINSQMGKKFDFSELANSTPNELDSIYANFTKFIYDQWIKLENPFIVNMSLWKYGSPKNGINSVYLPIKTETTPPPEGTAKSNLVNKLDNSTPPTEPTPPATPTTGTYVFPYFSNSNQTNSNAGTIDKFVNFIRGATTTNNYITDTTLGLIDIPQEHTEDSSTYILAKNGSIYNDLYIEFAAAATYQLYKGQNFMNGTATASPLVNNIDTDLSSSFPINVSSDLDFISSHFVKRSSINNRDIKLDKSLVDQIINTEGEFKGLSNNDLFITDAFIGQNPAFNNLEKFIFLRNEAGVHAIAIDGDAYIKNTNDTNIDNFKKRAGEIVLYRSLLNLNGYSNFAVDVQAELKTFLSNNFTWLINFYALTQSNANFLEFNESDFGTGSKTFVTALNSYIFDQSKYSRQNDYSNKMYESKSKYSNNYGVNAKDNGFAAPWIYTYQNGYNNFDIVKTIYQPSSNLETSYNTYKNAVTAFINALNSPNPIIPLQSSFAGFEYSQYIYTNNLYLNFAIINYGNDNNAMSNVIRNDTLLKYLSNDFNSSTYDFDIQSTTFNDSNFNTNLNKHLNEALNNKFFSSVFNGLQNKWYKYNNTIANSTAISYVNLNTYRKDLWKNNIAINNSTQSENKYNLYLLASTVKYLLENNAENFLSYLQSNISYGEDAYIAWYESQNQFLEPNAKNIDNLLNVSNTQLSMNINNSYKSSYYGSIPSDATVITNNTATNTNYSNNDSYYQYVGESVGFYGLQTQKSNKAPAPILERIFNDQTKNTDNTGFLYSFESRDKMVQYVKNIRTQENFEYLLTTLQKRINIDSLTNISTSGSLSDSINKLVAVLEDTSKITDVMFQPRTGYIASGNLTTNTSNLIQDTTAGQENLYYGAKVIHLNLSDTTSLTKLKDAIKKINTNLTDDNATNIFFNLVISAAMDSSVQANMINSLLSYDKNGIAQNRVIVYDVRLKTQLGNHWIKN